MMVPGTDNKPSQSPAAGETPSIRDLGVTGGPVTTEQNTGRAKATSLLEEGEQVGVDPIFMGRAQAVRRTFVDLQLSVSDQLGGEQGRGADRHDLVIVAMHDECRDVELPEVFREVRFGKGLDAVDRRL